MHWNYQIVDLGLTPAGPDSGKFATIRRQLIHIPVLHTQADMGPESAR